MTQSKDQSLADFTAEIQKRYPNDRVTRFFSGQIDGGVLNEHLVNRRTHDFKNYTHCSCGSVLEGHYWEVIDHVLDHVEWNFSLMDKPVFLGEARYTKRKWRKYYVCHLTHEVETTGWNGKNPYYPWRVLRQNARSTRFVASYITRDKAIAGGMKALLNDRGKGAEILNPSELFPKYSEIEEQVSPETVFSTFFDECSNVSEIGDLVKYLERARMLHSQASLLPALIDQLEEKIAKEAT